MNKRRRNAHRKRKRLLRLAGEFTRLSSDLPKLKAMPAPRYLEMKAAARALFFV